jgi:hypothetical protein
MERLHSSGCIHVESKHVQLSSAASVFILMVQQESDLTNAATNQHKSMTGLVPKHFFSHMYWCLSH